MAAGFNFTLEAVRISTKTRTAKKKPFLLGEITKGEKVKVLFWLMAQVTLPE